MSKKIAFTQARIKALPLPEKGRVDYYDTEIVKLTCRVSASGNKSFVVLKKFGTKTSRITVGNVDDLSVKDARDKAKIILADMAKGINPIKEKLKVMTLEGTLDHYLKNRHPKNGKELKPRTVDGYKKVLHRSFKDWRNKPVGSITPEMVVKRYKSLTAIGTTTANVGMRVLRLILKHAKAVGAVDDVATDVLVTNNAWHKNKRRDSMIKMAELQPWFEAVNVLENDRAKVYLLMLIFMGFRSIEALGLQWKDVNFKKKTITARNTKNGSDFSQPVPQQFMPYLVDLKAITGDSKWVFSGENPDKAMTVPKKPIAKVVAMTDIEFSSHSLRRTFATIAEAVGVPYGTIKRLLNHTIPENDVTLGYLVTEDEVIAENINKVGAFIYAKATKKRNVVRLHG